MAATPTGLARINDVVQSLDHTHARWRILGSQTQQVPALTRGNHQHAGLDEFRAAPAHIGRIRQDAFNVLQLRVGREEPTIGVAHVERRRTPANVIERKDAPPCGVDSHIDHPIAQQVIAQVVGETAGQGNLDQTLHRQHRWYPASDHEACGQTIQRIIGRRSRTVTCHQDDHRHTVALWELLHQAHQIVGRIKPGAPGLRILKQQARSILLVEGGVAHKQQHIIAAGLLAIDTTLSDGALESLRRGNRQDVVAKLARTDRRTKPGAEIALLGWPSDGNKIPAILEVVRIRDDKQQTHRATAHLHTLIEGGALNIAGESDAAIGRHGACGRHTAAIVEVQQLPGYSVERRSRGVEGQTHPQDAVTGHSSSPCLLKSHRKPPAKEPVEQFDPVGRQRCCAAERRHGIIIEL